MATVDETVHLCQRTLQLKTCTFLEPPTPGKGVRLGVYQVQADCGEGATAKNMARLEDAVGVAAAQGVQLLAFPELYVSGYTLSPADARAVAEPLDGPSVTRAREAAKAHGVALLVPYPEKAETPAGERLYDAIAIIAADGGLVASYRKTHLYAQQERDDFAFGDVLSPVFPVNDFPVAVLNCYECEFPELTRILALRGAKLVVGPTAADHYYKMADGKRSPVPYPDISTTLIPAYAYANDIFYAYANRAGYERRGDNHWRYRGNSIVCGPHGDVIVAAGHDQDTLLVADCVPEAYGPTHPEEPTYDYLKDRRPDLYGDLTATSAAFRPGGWTYPRHQDGKELGREK